MKITIYSVLFFLIFLLAVFFRLYNISSVPPSPSLDEVTIGYNAYSILQTGRDEYGYYLPILLRAYDDYRPALYVYLVIPFIKLFGLQVVAVRLPSVILSLITVVSTYFLVKELTKKYQYGKVVALLSMFLLAVSPWHIYISRLGHEANAGATFIVLGALFFLYSVNNFGKRWFIMLSALFYSLSFYTYQSEKVFTPLIVICLILLYWRKIFVIRKEAGVALVLAFLITVPIFRASLTPDAMLRLKGTSAFTNMDQLSLQNAHQLLVDKKQSNYFAIIIDNRRLIPVKIFFTNYFAHFNPYWLIANIGNNGKEEFKIPSIGLFYFWELPFFILGLLFLWLSNLQKKEKFLLLIWFLFAFIPPSIATGAPHAMRSYNILPVPQIIEGFGILGVFLLLSKQKHIVLRIEKILLGFLFVLLVGYSLVSLTLNYFYVFPKIESEPYQYALFQAFTYLVKNNNSSKPVIVGIRNNLFESYMFYLFVSHYNPSLYLKHGGTVSGGFAEEHRIGNISFHPINWDNSKKIPNAIYIGNPASFPESIESYKNFYYLDGTLGVKIVKT